MSLKPLPDCWNLSVEPTNSGMFKAQVLNTYNNHLVLLLEV